MLKFFQNFQKGLMVLIAVFIFLIILQAGSRMFMYEFSLKFICFLSLFFPYPFLILLEWQSIFLVTLQYAYSFQETLFDEFVLAHVLGWWGKAILIRNQPLLWVLSVGFEMMEVSVPNISLMHFRYQFTYKLILYSRIIL